LDGRRDRIRRRTRVLFTFIRDLFAMMPDAKARGFRAGRFSFKRQGRPLRSLSGRRRLAIEMHFLPDVYVTCEQCKGRRYNRETLEIKYRGKSIADVLELTSIRHCRSWRTFPRSPTSFERAGRRARVLELGQSATTLSGGEAQRVKLAKELSKRGTGRTLYILDERRPACTSKTRESCSTC